MPSVGSLVARQRWTVGALTPSRSARRCAGSRCRSSSATATRCPVRPAPAASASRSRTAVGRASATYSGRSASSAAAVAGAVGRAPRQIPYTVLRGTPASSASWASTRPDATSRCRRGNGSGDQRALAGSDWLPSHAPAQRALRWPAGASPGLSNGVIPSFGRRRGGAVAFLADRSALGGLRFAGAETGQFRRSEPPARSHLANGCHGTPRDRAFGATPGRPLRTSRGKVACGSMRRKGSERFPKPCVAGCRRRVHRVSAGQRLAGR